MGRRPGVLYQTKLSSAMFVIPSYFIFREAAWKIAAEESNKAGFPYEGEDGALVTPATHEKGLLEHAIEIFELDKQWERDRLGGNQSERDRA